MPETSHKTEPLPVRHFAECELDDPKPAPSWEPSPEQIQRWAAQIRDERETERRLPCQK